MWILCEPFCWLRQTSCLHLLLNSQTDVLHLNSNLCGHIHCRCICFTQKAQNYSLIHVCSSLTTEATTSHMTILTIFYHMIVENFVKSLLYVVFLGFVRSNRIFRCQLRENSPLDHTLSKTKRLILSFCSFERHIS